MNSSRVAVSLEDVCMPPLIPYPSTRASTITVKELMTTAVLQWLWTAPIQVFGQKQPRP